MLSLYALLHTSPVGTATYNVAIARPLCSRFDSTDVDGFLLSVEATGATSDEVLFFGTLS